MGKKKYTFNEDYFEVIDTEPKAYWLGFMAADGCVPTRPNRIHLDQSAKDIHHIQRFKEAIESDHPIRYKRYKDNDHQGARVTVNSKKMRDDLKDKGIIPRKSLILKPPTNVPERFIRHWIRGYFDGDGSIYKSHKKRNKKTNRVSLRAAIGGTREVCTFIHDLIPFNTPLRYQEKSSIWILHISRKKALDWLFSYFYKDATVFLERKYIKFRRNK